LVLDVKRTFYPSKIKAKGYKNKEVYHHPEKLFERLFLEKVA